MPGVRPGLPASDCVGIRHFERCGPSCYMKDYQRRREGKVAGEPLDPVDDSAIQEPRVIEALADVPRGNSMEREATSEKQSSDEIEDNDGTGDLHLDVVADRSRVPQTRFGEDNRVGVEWVGRCWAWLTEGVAATLMDVVVRKPGGRQAVGTGRGAAYPGGQAGGRNARGGGG